MKSRQTNIPHCPTKTISKTVTHPPQPILTLLQHVSEALFYTGVTTLFRDPWGGLSLVPLITILLRFVLLNFAWII